MNIFRTDFDFQYTIFIVWG